ncbi:MAG TPA: HEAT repeat domain-containing protein [Armatimonadota bacterium]|jgi:HEAT repeat protein|nr:HEAT repeat domain-containing protein [Armatimonadota bacterium]HOQ27190.1 HEAT repeat domain-containing protein [Armatimonadota bacterium]HPT99030.1 HEAT repeat domain-containing protein [Armatimonadota bacterium]
MSARQLRIRNAQDLIEGLTSPEVSVRLAVLGATGRNPQAALAYGAHEGRDVIDTLIEQATLAQGTSLWDAFAGVLSAFDDPRAEAFFREVLAEAEEPKRLILAEAYLSQRDVAPLRDLLSTMLLQSQSAPRARTAARLLTSCGPHSPEESIRMALVLELGEWTPPALDQTTAPHWISELQGPFDREARDLLETQGESAFQLLIGHWDAFSEENKEWLLRWGSRLSSPEVEVLLRRALDSGQDTLMLVALECLAERGGPSEDLAEALHRLVQHPNPAIRLAATRAGAQGIDWREMLAREADRGIRRECISRLAQEEGARALDDLVQLLENEEWDLRAAATSALIGLGSAVIPAMRRLVEHPAEGVRVAAVRVLVELGDDLWLEEKLIT